VPFLRLSRDKRGYEHTCVLQQGHGPGRGGARLLYWFRTPPGIRVGRRPLDDEAVGRIAAAHPELTFDWGRLRDELTNALDGPGSAAAGPAAGAGGRGGRRSRSKRTGSGATSGPPAV
jgi:hypothetical protein